MRKGKLPHLAALLFEHRVAVTLLFVFVTLFMGWQLRWLSIDASYDKMIATNHPFVKNWQARRDDVAGGNSLKIVVAPQSGTIFSAGYMSALRELNDTVFYLPGVDPVSVRSLWSADVRWREVTEWGFEGGALIPPDYDGSQASLEALKVNILRSGTIGQLVAKDLTSSAIHFTLQESDAAGQRLDYRALGEHLEKLREDFHSRGIDLHIVGFAKVVGDLLQSVDVIAIFFLLTLLMTSALLWFYSGCMRSTLAVLVCSVVAVMWQLGLLAFMGYGLDLYSILVPFLIFAIAVSHGCQVINRMMAESTAGTDSRPAAYRTFVALCTPGVTALVSDATGFLSLMMVEIEAIYVLALAASVGVAMVILTNLVLLPVLMSGLGVSKRARQRTASGPSIIFVKAVQALLSPVAMTVTLVTALAAATYGIYKSGQLKVGDLEQGAPELHVDSRYNRDNAVVVQNYSASSDTFVVMVETGKEGCVSFPFLAAIDRYMWHMSQVPGVQNTFSLVTVAKQAIRGMNEGNPQWQTLSTNQWVLNSAIGHSPISGLHNSDCSLAPVVLSLQDHKGETLAAVVEATRQFAAANNSDTVRFRMAAGNAGIEAATNEVVQSTHDGMLAAVFLVVGLLCMILFRSWRALVCIMVPLALTSLLCYALMAHLGIGIKVATLPVAVLGVGIGVDYGIYIYASLNSGLIEGKTVRQACLDAIFTTGRAVLFTAMALAIGVGSWIFSPIRFQADMGILLSFMFVWNMVGALILLPVLAHIVHSFDTGRLRLWRQVAGQSRIKYLTARSTDPKEMRIKR